MVCVLPFYLGDPSLNSTVQLLKKSTKINKKRPGLANKSYLLLVPFNKAINILGLKRYKTVRNCCE